MKANTVGVFSITCRERRVLGWIGLMLALACVPGFAMGLTIVSPSGALHSEFSHVQADPGESWQSPESSAIRETGRQALAHRAPQKTYDCLRE